MTGNMKGYAIEKDGSRRIVTVPIPKPGPYQALVKIEACGVCNGTDIKLAHQNFKNFSTYPALLGHEAVGSIVELGEKVSSFRTGDRVTLPFGEDTAGYYSGWGGYSEYGLVGDIAAIQADGLTPDSPYWSESYFAQNLVPASLTSAEATMIVTFREVLGGIKNFGMTPGKRIVIFGAGPVGLIFTKLLSLSGVEEITVLDLVPEKAQRALQHGAKHAFCSAGQDAAALVRDIYPDGVDMVLDAVGVSAIINTAMSLIVPGGKICCYGISPNLQMNLDWSRAPYNWGLQFEQWPSKIQEGEQHKQICGWIESGQLVPSQYISEEIPFEEIDRAFDMIEQKKTDLKNVIVF